MTNVKIATGAEQPINRDAAVSAITAEEGDLVGLDASGNWVEADAVASANGGDEINAVGVLMAPVSDPANYTHEELKVVIQSQRELVGEDRIAAAKYGIIVENSDEDWGFTVGEPVYLGADGAYTQSPPSTSGDIKQVVGMATDDGEAVFIDIETGYSNV